LGILSEGLAALGHRTAAHAALDEALDWSRRSGERWCVADLLRAKGVLLLETDTQSTSAAEALLQEALELAQQQGALFWELRVATDLARLWLQRGEADRAWALLHPVHQRFTEGFDTADMVQAQELLGLAGSNQSVCKSVATPGDATIS
jgi:predicted ATPase